MCDVKREWTANVNRVPEARTGLTPLMVLYEPPVDPHKINSGLKGRKALLRSREGPCRTSVL